VYTCRVSESRSMSSLYYMTLQKIYWNIATKLRQDFNHLSSGRFAVCELHGERTALCYSVYRYCIIGTVLGSKRKLLPNEQMVDTAVITAPLLCQTGTSPVTGIHGSVRGHPPGALYLGRHPYGVGAGGYTSSLLHASRPYERLHCVYGGAIFL